MSDQEPGEPQEISAQGSVVKGNVKVTNGDFVGRDKNEGLNIDGLVAALRQAFPPGDARPERLRHLFDEFREYHAKLYEWKELHNALNRIIDAFDQYAAQVESSYVQQKPLKPSVYREAWRPVNRYVDGMLDWAQTIQHIGEAYQALSSDRLKGERWAVDIKAQRDVLMAHFQIGQAVEKSMSGAAFPRLFQANPAPDWLQQLYNLTHEFEDVIKKYMSQADSQLRETATDLYGLSEQALGS